MITIYTLEKGAVYVVTQTFTDFYGTVFSEGERLTYEQRHFLPYDGGHTLIFKEGCLYLQEDINKDIIDNFSSIMAIG